ncbi:MAG: site-specific integrase [Magnetococcales bacterium]|nr:site-specific integrase [Magnetococcales bacterium]
MATIRKTSSGRWRAEVRKRGFPAQSKSFERKGDASRWAAQVEESMSSGSHVAKTVAEQMSVKEAMKKYLEEVSVKKAASTESREQLRARTLISHLGDYALANLTVDVLAQYRDKRLKTVSANSIRLEFALLGHMIKTAIREWRIGLTFNPVDQIAKPRLPRGRSRRLLPAEEIRLFKALDEATNRMMSQIVRLALETGMRKNEILKLKKSDVKLSRKIIIVREHEERGHAKSPREVPLTEVAEEVILEAVNFAANFLETDYIFFGSPGKDGQIRPYLMDKNWNLIVKKAGLKDFHFHDLRHEAVSRMVEMGLSDQQVSAISGHQTLQMLKRYTHLRGEDLGEVLRSKKRVVLSVKDGTGSK